MKKTLAIFILSISFVISLNSQSLFSIGVKGMITSDITSRYDEGNLLNNNANHYTTAYSFFLEKKMKDNFHLEIGVTIKEYYTGFGYNQQYNTNGVVDDHIKSMNSIQIPIVVKYKYSFLKNISLNPNIGYVLLINNSFNNTLNSTVEFGDISLSQDVNTSFNETFPLIKLGTDVEFSFSKNHSILLGFGYHKGFKKTIENSIVYHVPISSLKNATIKSEGSYWSYGLSYLYSL